jgi:hypothetical protein
MELEGLKIYRYAKDRYLSGRVRKSNGNQMDGNNHEQVTQAPDPFYNPPPLRDRQDKRHWRRSIELG